MKLLVPPFESDDQMLAWCKEVGITPPKDAAGHWDWQQLYRQRDAERERLFGKPRVLMKLEEGETIEEFKKRVKEELRKKGFFNKGNTPPHSKS